MLKTARSSFVWTKKWNMTDGQTDKSAVAITAVCIASNADVLQKRKRIKAREESERYNR